LAKSGRVAIAELVSRGKERLMLTGPIKKVSCYTRCITHTRCGTFSRCPKGEKANVSEKELELGIDLIDGLTSEEFHPENYEDDYRIRVLAMLDEKTKGKEITIAAPAPQRGGNVVDIMEASKRSRKESRPRERTPRLLQLRKKRNSLKAEKK
jgi:DNA end-binding protein Ku